MWPITQEQLWIVEFWVVLFDEIMVKIEKEMLLISCGENWLAMVIYLMKFW